jgi:nanoRNase/pAp phosphatase (c-di-AMP/oligoRNAs hydrolase)
MKNYQVDQIKNLLSNAKTALVVVPQINVDSVGSALALALLLKKSNIETKVFSPQKTDANYQKLSGLELLTDTVKQNDLIVSLNYPTDQIEQVSYNDDGGRLNLVVKTKENSPKIENNQIIINNQPSTADIGFMFGDESSLGPNASIVNKGNWVFISPVDINKSWAKASIIDPDAPFSEIFTFLLPMLGLRLDADSAKNLLIALRVATQSFSVNVSPETFEAGATCLRATQPSNSSQGNYNQPSQPTQNPSATLPTA